MYTPISSFTRSKSPVTSYSYVTRVTHAPPPGAYAGGTICVRRTHPGRNYEYWAASVLSRSSRPARTRKDSIDNP